MVKGGRKKDRGGKRNKEEGGTAGVADWEGKENKFSHFNVRKLFSKEKILSFSTCHLNLYFLFNVKLVLSQSVFTA